MAGQDERSLGELFGRLGKELGTLVRQEIRLAQTEMSQKVTVFSRAGAMLAVGGLMVYAGVLALIATVVIILATVGLPWWLSALIVTVVVLALGAVLVQQGIEKLKHASLAPQQTVRSIKEDVEWVKEQAR
jgi:uncharacterized membrane protein YqjE